MRSSRARSRACSWAWTRARRWERAVSIALIPGTTPCRRKVRNSSTSSSTTAAAVHQIQPFQPGAYTVVPVDGMCAPVISLPFDADEAPITVTPSVTTTPSRMAAGDVGTKNPWHVVTGNTQDPGSDHAGELQDETCTRPSVPLPLAPMYMLTAFQPVHTKPARTTT